MSPLFIQFALSILSALFFLTAFVFLIKLNKSNKIINLLKEKYEPFIEGEESLDQIKDQIVLAIKEKEKHFSEMERKLLQVESEITEKQALAQEQSKKALLQEEMKIKELKIKFENDKKQMIEELEKNAEIIKSKLSLEIETKKQSLSQIEKDMMCDYEEKKNNNNKKLEAIELKISELKIKFENDKKQMVEELEKNAEIIKSKLSLEIETKKQSLSQIEKDMMCDYEEKKNNNNKKLEAIELKISELKNDYDLKHIYFQKLTNEISSLEETNEIISCGLYNPHFDFETSDKYKEALLGIREKEREMIKEESATHCNTRWTVNGSVTEGKKQTKYYTKLMLRAFNGECEALLADVRWNNVKKMEERLKKSFDAINKLGETHNINITKNYFELKMNEFYLTHEYREKLYLEKEEQRRIQEQIREEQRAQKEIEKTLKDSEDEEKRYAKALEQARKEIENAQGENLAKVQLRISTLENQLEEAQKQKQRALSMAQQTKIGHVYVISNIGSFGENIYKIGMTRRLDPLDRVRELGGASVPFEFDVHAMIFSEDAPALENKLHKHFYQNRLNMVNDRKEFFKIKLEEIERIANQYGDTIEFIKTAEARSYHESIAIRESLTDRVLENKLPDKFPTFI